MTDEELRIMKLDINLIANNFQIVKDSIELSGDKGKSISKSDRVFLLNLSCKHGNQAVAIMDQLIEENKRLTSAIDSVKESIEGF